MKDKNQMLFFKSLDLLAEKLHKSFDEIKGMMETIFEESYQKKFDPDAIIKLEIDIDNKEIKLLNKSVEVVEDDYEIEENEKTFLISLSDAKKINPRVKVDDTITRELSFELFERDIINRISQLLRQKVRKISKEYVFEKYNALKGSMINAIPVTIRKDGSIIFKLPDSDNVMGYLPNAFRNTLIPMEKGKLTKVFVYDVLEESRDEQIILSQSSKEFIEEILKDEIPEIADGTVKIEKIVRIAGLRSKVLVSSSSKVVDPLAACIGVRGIRIIGIIKRLKGEKIDIIKSSDEELQLLKDAMTPSAVISIKKQEDNSFLVIVPNNHLSLAIGRGGSNVKLVFQIVENKVDIKSYEKAIDEEIEFEWNGNVNHEEVTRIHNGERVMFRSIAKKPTKKFVFEENFESDIYEFNNSIFNQKHGSNDEEEDININVNLTEDEEEFHVDLENSEMFSDEELRKMEQEFGFDSDFDMDDPQSFEEFENNEKK